MAASPSSSLSPPTSDLSVVIVTPEETVLETSAGFVALPLFDGELGVLKGHSPMIGRLGYGELRLKTGSETERYYVDGGFVQVANDVVTVLTGYAVSAKKLKAGEAAEQLKESLARHATNPVETALRQRAVDRARAKRRMAGK